MPDNNFGRFKGVISWVRDLGVLGLFVTIFLMAFADEKRRTDIFNWFYPPTSQLQSMIDLSTDEEGERLLSTFFKKLSEVGVEEANNRGDSLFATAYPRAMHTIDKEFQKDLDKLDKETLKKIISKKFIDVVAENYGNHLNDMYSNLGMEFSSKKIAEYLENTYSKHKTIVTVLTTNGSTHNQIFCDGQKFYSNQSHIVLEKPKDHVNVNYIKDPMFHYKCPGPNHPSIYVDLALFGVNTSSKSIKLVGVNEVDGIDQPRVVISCKVAKELWQDDIELDDKNGCVQKGTGYINIVKAEPL